VDAVATQQKRLALLVFLAVEGVRGPVERDRICGVFWPDYDQDRARANLRNALHFLRKTLGPEVIGVIGDERLHVDPRMLSCDASEVFRKGAGPADAVFLKGVHIRGAGADFYDWVDTVRHGIASLPIEWRPRKTLLIEQRLGNAPPIVQRPGEIPREVLRAKRPAPLKTLLVASLTTLLLIAGLGLSGRFGEGDTSGGGRIGISVVDRARRVLVLPMEPRGGTADLGELAEMGSHWLMRRLIESDVAEVVEYRSIAATLGETRPVDLGRAADLAFADLIVTGEVRVENGDLVVHPRIVRAPELQTEATLPGERAEMDRPLRAFDRAADRVLAALSAQLSTTWRWPVHRPPPTLEVMRLEQQALDAFYVIDYERFRLLADSAMAIDSTYLPALMLTHQASAFWNQRNLDPRNFHLSDSTLTYMEARAEHLSPRERRGLKWMRSIVAGDPRAEYEAAADPTLAIASQDRPYRLAMTAGRTNHLPLALELIDKRYLMHPRVTQYRAWDQVHLRVLARLRDFESLQAALSSAMERHPSYGLYLQLEAQALAATGDFEAISDVVLRSRALPQDQEFNPASHLAAAAEVAWSEGYRAEARSLASEALEVAPDLSSELDLRETEALAHAVLGDWERTSTILAEIVETEAPPEDHLNRLGRYGAALANANHIDEAHRVLQELDAWIDDYRRFYLAGVARWNQARIHAEIGDTDRAIALLQSAVETGMSHGMWEMWDLHLQALRDDARYQRIVAIKPVPAR